MLGVQKEIKTFPIFFLNIIAFIIEGIQNLADRLKNFPGFEKILYIFQIFVFPKII
jgi:hypothetical protein